MGAWTGVRNELVQFNPKYLLAKFLLQQMFASQLFRIFKYKYVSKLVQSNNLGNA